MAEPLRFPRPPNNSSLRGTEWQLPRAYSVSTGWITGNGPRTSVWVLLKSPENGDRYRALFGSPSPPVTVVEMMERAAGAYFYTHWHKCEALRHLSNPTMTTNMARGEREKTAENMQLAREELDQNTLGLPEGMLVEERKTLEWVEEEFRDEQERERTLFRDSSGIGAAPYRRHRASRWTANLVRRTTVLSRQSALPVSRRDEGVCCLTGRSRLWWDVLGWSQTIVTPIISDGIDDLFGSAECPSNFEVCLKYFTMSKYGAAAFREGRIQLEPDWNIEQRPNDDLKSTCRYSLWAIIPVLRPLPITSQGCSLRSGSVMEMMTTDPKSAPLPSAFLLGTHHRFCNALKLLEIDHYSSRVLLEHSLGRLGYGVTSHAKVAFGCTVSSFGYDSSAWTAAYARALHDVLSRERTALAKDLRTCIQQLRKIPNTNKSAICDSNGGPMFEYRLSGRLGGPFHSEAEFNDFVITQDRLRDQCHERHHRICFTHADLNPNNILIEAGRLSGIVDFGCAVYHSEYWEYTKAMFSTPGLDASFPEMFKAIFGDTHRDELNAEQKLWRVRSTL
ncbi:uncharacterized protein BP5553_02970 [Venustampulla echinocandica]|uniref:Aminoglycoside phosphotransferase domain-containing protein n=1 Tax=Venustampulla echinocandica TaxID=2656787 RepID=A0A370TSW2_9HELO|nr:uncharacterized protein BP5553_02970 [Venustampulla echinocandica]RDL38630.1 hypothetical protein BP5553_02970 [Venustampulla echinocandica]